MDANRPRDGPATNFTADPLVESLFTKEDDYFGLVLVAGWPPNQLMDSTYQTYLDQVRNCFDKADFEDDNGTAPPNVYLYPTQCLHVTIATLYHVKKREPDFDEDYYIDLQEKYINLVKAAAQRNGWPTSNPLNLKLESVQLGQKAGIFLWEDTSGQINAMRTCLKEEAELNGIKIHSIPDIVHSTFLRFARDPTGSGKEIQQKFQTYVASHAAQNFRSVLAHSNDTAWDCSLCKLVNETTPYMHIPNDKDHVLAVL